MNLRKLGKEGPDISPISFGAWGIGGPPFWSDKDKSESIKAIHAAIDIGVNMIDTAPVYGFGRSEEIVGEAIAGRRDKVLIATKCGLSWKSEELGSIENDLSPGSIIQEVDASLRRLKTDYIDIYQVHWPDPKCSTEQTMVALYLLQRMGKVRYIGVSNFNIEQLSAANEFASITSLQPKLNMLEREIIGNELKVCIEKEIGVLAYSPLASGLLTGKYDENSTFDGWRNNAKFGIFQKKKLAPALKTVQKLKDFAKARNTPLSHIAINWVISQQGITSAIVGANTAEQINDNVKALDFELSNDDMSELSLILNSGAA